MNRYIITVIRAVLRDADMERHFWIKHIVVSFRRGTVVVRTPTRSFSTMKWICLWLWCSKMFGYLLLLYKRKHEYPSNIILLQSHYRPGKCHSFLDVPGDGKNNFYLFRHVCWRFVKLSNTVRLRRHLLEWAKSSYVIDIFIYQILWCILYVITMECREL